MTRALRIGLAAFALLSTGTAHAQPASSLRGKWVGRIAYDSVTVEFPLSWSTNRQGPVLSLFNGTDSISSTRVDRRGDSVIVEFSHLATRLRGVVNDGSFSGWYGSTTRRDSARVEAAPTARPKATTLSRSAAAPDISGTWIVPVTTAKGEGAWRLVVRDTRGTVTATLLRVDGDAGALVGRYDGTRWSLHHFDGTRPARLDIAIDSAGSLRLDLHTPRGTRRYSAWRPLAAKARGIPEPADVSTHTRVRNPAEPFRFAFPDLDGTLVTNDDARFRGKVLLINVTGSWCPNCHDEAPFLTELHRRYREQGLEIVALDFEEEEQRASLSRVRAFVARYAVSYPYLIGGTPDEVNRKIPQAVNLNTWPATFFVGRDGTVRAVRTGFAAKASGEYHRQLVAEYEAIVQELLAEGRADGPGR